MLEVYTVNSRRLKVEVQLKQLIYSSQKVGDIKLLYLGRDKLAMFTITVYVNFIVYIYLYIDARAQVFSAI